MYKLFSTHLLNKLFFFIKNQINSLFTILFFFLLSSCISPKESLNLISQNPKKTKELEKLLMNYLKNVHAPKWQEGITWKSLPLSEINSNY